jgi:hypothetical protein
MSAVKLGFYFLWIYIFLIFHPTFVDYEETSLWTVCIVLECMFMLFIQFHEYFIQIEQLISLFYSVKNFQLGSRVKQYFQAPSGMWYNTEYIMEY